MVARRFRKLDSARHDIWNGDLLLFPSRGLISRYGRGRYSHAAMAGWWGNELCVLESREFRGTVCTAAANRIKPGMTVDVHRPECSHAHREAAFRGMKSCLGLPYNYAGVVRAALCHVPIANRKSASEYAHDGRKKFDRAAHCSQRYSNVWRVFASIDWVPNLSDELVEPNDLARCRDLVYQFTVEG